MTPPSPPRTLKKRAEFLRVAGSGRKWAMPGLLLQAGPSPLGPDAPLRYGVTASRKVGNAVIRNRAKRRLRALARSHLPQAALPGMDYVLIARLGTPERPYDDLIRDLKTALARLKVARPEATGGEKGLEPTS